MTTTNQFGQPVGDPVPGWSPRPWPAARAWAGRWCRLEPLRADVHAEDLYQANRLDEQGRMWTYLSCGPFEDLAAYRRWLDGVAGGRDPLFFAVLAGEPRRAIGVAAYLRVMPAEGSIEVGHLAFSPALQRTTAATEAMALMMAYAFDELGYRRYEWKCDALNAPSRRAAQRLGFVYEGTFRQAAVVRGRNRDTAWFSVTDAEWPRLKEAFRLWLDPGNFGPDGRQRVALSALGRPAPYPG
jgi:RimJ/RimL family protein N-acetyltransferase